MQSKTEVRKETEVCPHLYYRPFHYYTEDEHQLCEINHKSCVRQGRCSCYIFDEFLRKLEV